MIRNRSTTDANTKSPTENKNVRKTILFYQTGTHWAAIYVDKAMAIFTSIRKQ
jgi:hypothetical protein